MTVACTSEPAATTTTSTTVAITTTTSSTSTTTVPETTTTVFEDQRIAEVTEIVREVVFGWFDAIYNKDKDALQSVVAVQQQFDTGVGAMDNPDYFVAQPTSDSLVIDVKRILADTNACLAVTYYANAEEFRGEGAETERTEVYWPRPSDGSWRSAYLGDEWSAACELFSREDQLP
jgi:hypothetical protein